MFMYMYLFTGTRFASGGADRTVIIWNAESIEAILKYTHTDSIQCLSYSPVSQQLLSCTASYIGKSCNVRTMCQCVLHIHVYLGHTYSVRILYIRTCTFITVLVLLCMYNVSMCATHTRKYTYILAIYFRLRSCYNVHVYTCTCAFIVILVLLYRGRQNPEFKYLLELLPDCNRSVESGAEVSD